MAKIDVPTKTQHVPLPSLKPGEKKMNFANNMAKQQKGKPFFGKNQQISGRRMGKK